MVEILFANETIDTNWITGHSSLNYFLFHGCFFNTIRSLLLTDGAKTDVIFEFKSLPQDVTIEAGAFKGFQIKKILFENCWMHYLDSNVFLTSKKSVEEIGMHRYPRSYDLNTILNGAEKWPRLKVLRINSSNGFNKTITAANFTTLAVIEHLDLASCSIVNIELGVFDS